MLRKFSQMIKFLLMLSLISHSLLSVAETYSTNNTQPQIIPPYDMQRYDREIETIYRTIPRNNNIKERVASISEFFLGKPYLLGAFGEGPTGEFDQSPLYRTDSFDCVTYISIVLALAEANNLQEFKNIIKRINYNNGVVAFVKRNHFTSVDWNTENLHNGFLQDITYKIIDQSGLPVAQVTEAIIEKPNWFAKLTINNIKLLKAVSNEQAQQLLQKLHAQGQQLQNEKTVVTYLPLATLFNETGQPNDYIFQQIPHGSIIEIVRPNWDLREKIGTHLQISHLGFAIRTPEGLMFRNASLNKKQITDIPLTVYLQQYLNSPTIKGINVLQITNPPIVRK